MPKLLTGLDFPAWFLFEYSNLSIFLFPHFIAFAAMLLALRVIIVWAYSHTNSLLLSQLIHVNSTGFLFVLTPVYSQKAHSAIFYTVYAVFLWVVTLNAIRKMAGASR